MAISDLKNCYYITQLKFLLYLKQSLIQSVYHNFKFNKVIKAVSQISEEKMDYAIHAIEQTSEKVILKLWLILYNRINSQQMKEAIVKMKAYKNYKWPRRINFIILMEGRAVKI